MISKIEQSDPQGAKKGASHHDSTFRDCYEKAYMQMSS